MKTINVWVCALVLLGMVTGCSDEVFLEEETVNSGEAPFVLYASCDPGTDTRLAFGEDGLSLKWENGDKLALIDVSDMGQTSSPIYLTTQLDEPSSTAVFRSEYAVPAGRYFVRSVAYTNYGKTERWMQFGTSEFSLRDYETDYSLQNLVDWQQYPSKDFLYAPVIEIAEGQVSATIELRHAFAMLKINLTGGEQLADYGTLSIGMLCPTKAFPIFFQVDEAGEISQILVDSPKLQLGSGMYEDDVQNRGALIPPVNMSGQKVYFYVAQFFEGYDLMGEVLPRVQRVYEFVKDGKDLKAGVCYTVNLDLSEAKLIEIEDCKLSTPDHFRAFAYSTGNDTQTYQITQDIDFQGEVYFPMSTLASSSILEGNGHTLSNLTIDWPFDGAGLFDYLYRVNINNLKLKNVTINGKNQVGAFCGKTESGSSLSNCDLLGTNSISGTESYVGGLIGAPRSVSSLSENVGMSNCSVSVSTTVSGQNFVGGMAGRISWVSASRSEAEVLGGNNVGGIAGCADGQISECESFARVIATGDLAGGIVGGTRTFDVMYYSAGKVNQSSFSGTVTGQNYVGGIVGSGGSDNTITESYSIGDITGSSNVGGITGSGCVVTDCYSLSKITGTDEATTAGITGGETSGTVEKCYFAGTLTGSDYGISGKGKLYKGVYSNIKNCLTTAAKLSTSDPESDASYVNLSSIQSQVDYINADKVYSEETVWDGYPNDCPLFLWQIPSTETKGVVAPAFGTDEW